MENSLRIERMVKMACIDVLYDWQEEISFCGVSQQLPENEKVQQFVCIVLGIWLNQQNAVFTFTFMYLFHCLGLSEGLPKAEHEGTFILGTLTMETQFTWLQNPNAGR